MTSLVVALLALGCAGEAAVPRSASAGEVPEVEAAASLALPQVPVVPETVSVTSVRGTRVRYVAPVPPARQVDVRMPDRVASGKEIRVASGANLQAALDRAQPGDHVVLARGAVFTGNFVLPKKRAGADWIIVRAESEPSPAGVRVNERSVAGMPRVVTANAEAAIRTAPGAARWRLMGFEVAQGAGSLNFGLVVLGVGDETSLAQQPSHIVLDRMYVHGSPTADLKRCVAFNGASLAVIDSWLAECHGKGFDAQGIAGWNGPGPFHIENNRIEGSGQAIMFGGADPKIANLSPSDITIRRNHLYKPLSWGRGRWTVKATFELKHGKRVLFEGNILENHWADAQTGFAILFQGLSDNNTAWGWTAVQDVMVRNNVIKASTSGANVLSRVAYDGGPMPTNPGTRIALVNNLFLEVGRDPISGTTGRVFQLMGDLQDMTVVNNTATLTAGAANHAVTFDGTAMTRLTLVNNVFPTSEYGVFGSGKGSGTGAITHFAPGAVFRGNVVPNQNGSTYPSDNVFPAASAVRGLVPSKDPARKCETLDAWMSANRLPSTAGVSCAGLPKAEDASDPPDGAGVTGPNTKSDPEELQ